MKLSILIATVGRRSDKFRRLLGVLMPQVKRSPDIEVIAYWNNGEEPIGKIRKDLIEYAKGDYICFIDDDDLIPNDYCELILEALKSKPDYVGFRVRLFNDGVEMPPVFHSVRYEYWSQDEAGYYRNITHLNPIKRSIAQQGKFEGGVGEDVQWSESVFRLVKTEVYIDKVMYFYYHDRFDTNFGGSHKSRGFYKRPIIKRKNFSYHPNSKKES